MACEGQGRNLQQIGGLRAQGRKSQAVHACLLQMNQAEQCKHHATCFIRCTAQRAGRHMKLACSASPRFPHIRRGWVAAGPHELS